MTACRRYSIYSATAEDWAGILDLAHRWSFPEIKHLSIRELESLPMDNVDRIVLYHKYDIDRKLLIPSYAALCEAEKFVSIEDALRLGMETVLQLSRARECARNTSGCRSPSRAALEPTEMHEIVKEHFGVQERTEDQNGDHNAASTGGSVMLTCDRYILRSDSFYVQEEAVVQPLPKAEISPAEQPPGETGPVLVAVETTQQETAELKQQPTAEVQIPQPTAEVQIPLKESSTDQPAEKEEKEAGTKTPPTKMPTVQEDPQAEPEVESETDKDGEGESDEESETVKGEEESETGKEEDSETVKGEEESEVAKGEEESETVKKEEGETVKENETVEREEESVKGEKEDEGVIKGDETAAAAEGETKGGTEGAEENGTGSTGDDGRTTDNETTDKDNISVAQPNDPDHTGDAGTPRPNTGTAKSAIDGDEAMLGDASSNPTLQLVDVGTVEDAEASTMRISTNASESAGHEEDDDDDSQTFYDSPEGPEPPVSIDELLG